MNIRQNEINEKGEKCYNVKSQNLEDRHDLVRFRRQYNGKYAVSSLEGRDSTHETFESAAEDFEERTGDTPPEPEWLK